VGPSAARFLASPRLAVTRGLYIAAVAAALYHVRTMPVAPERMIGLAVLASAGIVAPLVLISLWPRAGSTAAVVALLTGGFGIWRLVVLRDGPADPAALARGAVFAGGAALLAGI